MQTGDGTAAECMDLAAAAIGSAIMDAALETGLEATLRVRSRGTAAHRCWRDAAPAGALDAGDDRDDGADRGEARAPLARARARRPSASRCASSTWGRARGATAARRALGSTRSSMTASCGSRSRSRPSTGARSASAPTSGGSSRPDSPPDWRRAAVLISQRRASEVCRSSSGSGLGRRGSGRRRGEGCRRCPSARSRSSSASLTQSGQQLVWKVDAQPPVLAGGAHAGSPLAVPAV